MSVETSVLRRLAEMRETSAHRAARRFNGHLAAGGRADQPAASALAQFVVGEQIRLADWLMDHADVLTNPPSAVGLVLDGAPSCPCGSFWCSGEINEEMRRYDAWWQREFESGRYDYVEGVG